MSDDMYAADARRGGNAAIEELSEFTFDGSNMWVLNIYQTLYEVNYRANVILDNIEPDSPVKKRAIAEAHFFRGWAHFYLAALFGTPPIVDHVLTASEYTQPNSDKAELWGFIQNEFATAANSGDLAEKSGPNDKVMRVTKTAAQAMLGKAYVFDQKWAEARTVLDEVINSGKYALYTGPYENLLLFQGEHSCENVLEANIIEDKNNRIGGWPACMELVFGWRAQNFHIDGDATDLHTSIGYGIGHPMRGLYDAFVEMEGANGYRLTNSLKNYDQIKAMGCYILPGVTLEQHDGIFLWKIRAQYRSFTYGGVYYGYQSHNNRRYMRYAEVLLLAAEAHLQAGGDATKATTYLNEVRARAQLAPVASATMDDVKKEKRLELHHEGVRFLDLVRWGDAPTALGNKGQAVGVFSADGTWIPDYFSNPNGGFKTGKNEVLPFPTLEMTVNKNLVQNPGY